MLVPVMGVWRVRVDMLCCLVFVGVGMRLAGYAFGLMHVSMVLVIMGMPVFVNLTNVSV
jgi:hypothetical protein